MSFFRIQSPTRPSILDPEFQTSESYSNFEDIRTGVSVCDGPYADEDDQDAHMGASLIHPAEIIASEPIADSFMDEIFAAYDAANS